MKPTRVVPLALLALPSCPALAEVDGAAVLSGAVGGAAGAAIATDRPGQRTVVKKEVIVEKEAISVKTKRHDNGLHLGHHQRGHRDD